LKLVYGAMPPDAMTLMYAAAKGISRSKFDDRSLALELGTARNPANTKSGSGTKISTGKIWKSKTITIATTDTGRVSMAVKNINEM